MVFDPSNDWEILDGLLAARYYQRLTETTWDSEPDGTPTSVIKLEDQMEYESGDERVKVSQHEATFLTFPGAFLFNATLRKGDKFTLVSNIPGQTAVTVTWYVLAVRYESFLRQWELRCYQDGHAA